VNILPAVIAVVAVSAILTLFRWSRMRRGGVGKPTEDDRARRAMRMAGFAIVVTLVVIGLIRRWMGQ
jgi:hypothetical protein